jgi:hypothetical protein
VQVFLSYRRGDAGGYAGRLTDALRDRLGSKSVFQDVTTIVPGQDFTVAIDGALDSCDAVLAVIGPGWTGRWDGRGDAPGRLFEADDYVRLELGRALQRSVPVVPVLVGGASLPNVADLPAELQGLVHRQAVVLHDDSWHRDVDGLVRALRGEPDDPHSKRRRGRFLAAGGVSVLLVAVALGAWWRARGNSGGGSSAELPSCAPPQAAGWAPIALGPNPVGQETEGGGTLRFRVTGAFARPQQGTWDLMFSTAMENATTDHVYHGSWRYDSAIVGRRAFVPTCFAPNPNLVAPGTVGDALVGFEVRCQPTGYMELVLESDRISVTDPTLEPSSC